MLFRIWYERWLLDGCGSKAGIEFLEDRVQNNFADWQRWPVAIPPGEPAHLASRESETLSAEAVPGVF